MSASPPTSDTNHSKTLLLQPPPLRRRLKETFFSYVKFGYIAFGGPSAHVAILYDEIIVKRRWVSNEQFAELVSISQALPGPASAKIAYSLALIRSGVLCAIFAFLLWSIPGAIVMTVVGVLIGGIKGDIPIWAVRLGQGLSAAAIGLVILAAYRMSTVLTTDRLTRVLALIAGSTTALYSAPWLLPLIMVLGGISSFVFDAYITPVLTRRRAKKAATSHKAVASVESKDLEQGDAANELETTESILEDEAERGDKATRYVYSRLSGIVCFAVFVVLLIAAILVRVLISPTETGYGQLASTFYVVGSIIFGGGHVVVPLLKTYTVDAGWLTNQQFLIGLAVIQSLPGPNFNFACFLGAVAMARVNKNTLLGAIISYIAIYFPGLILKNAIIPFWQFFRERPAVKMIFRGVNSCALGFIFSAAWLLWVQTTADGGSDSYHAVIVATAFVASEYLNIPVPLVIVVGGAMGAIEYAVTDT
ncbi:chromate transporter-domain-containing protein [Lobosporangium transversale]|uniref:Chromate transporter-domain-containing protein n=1 Tax=Lobosporangium transversale TaxID=64571 RepID=A0A1Y2GG45_9FUNG|nr:chromate transporter-domain-containing protein [Lobosporangium transversale]ORZ09967.1 chromate transporter-domain-containing protein [Lobosporangium transversale]|eukprot:XP_021879057.1 chromate transporter-domain-containing protein [Lobosporangium transversale]